VDEGKGSFDEWEFYCAKHAKREKLLPTAVPQSTSDSGRRKDERVRSPADMKSTLCPENVTIDDIMLRDDGSFELKVCVNTGKVGATDFAFASEEASRPVAKNKVWMDVGHGLKVKVDLHASGLLAPADPTVEPPTMVNPAASDRSNVALPNVAPQLLPAAGEVVDFNSANDVSVGGATAVSAMWRVPAPAVSAASAGFASTDIAPKDAAPTHVTPPNLNLLGLPSSTGSSTNTVVSAPASAVEPSVISGHDDDDEGHDDDGSGDDGDDDGGEADGDNDDGDVSGGGDDDDGDDGDGNDDATWKRKLIATSAGEGERFSFHLPPIPVLNLSFPAIRSCVVFPSIESSINRFMHNPSVLV
jgi:hypothetical protein